MRGPIQKIFAAASILACVLGASLSAHASGKMPPAFQVLEAGDQTRYPGFIDLLASHAPANPDGQWPFQWSGDSQGQPDPQAWQRILARRAQLFPPPYLFFGNDAPGFPAYGNYVIGNHGLPFGGHDCRSERAACGHPLAHVPDKVSIPSSVPFMPSDVTPAIPEPESYALMLAGLAAIGLALRRRKSH